MIRFLLVLMLLGGFSAHAGEWKTIEALSAPLNVASGTTESLQLPAQYSIYKLLIQASGVGRADALFDVVVNGDTKGTIHVPGQDPTYIVTVNQQASSIQFRSLSGSAFRVERVMVVMPPADLSAGNSLSALPDTNLITHVALKMIEITRQIESIATPIEQDSFVLPIRSTAGQLYAIASARGPYSERVFSAEVEVLIRVDAAKPFINEQMKRNVAFESMVQLLSLRAYLDRLIN